MKDANHSADVPYNISARPDKKLAAMVLEPEARTLQRETHAASQSLLRSAATDPSGFIDALQAVCTPGVKK